LIVGTALHSGFLCVEYCTVFYSHYPNIVVRCAKQVNMNEMWIR
jgi:hypothetical protein